MIETAKTYTSLMDIRTNELSLIFHVKQGWRTDTIKDNMLNDIKKALYKEKPIATYHGWDVNGSLQYDTKAGVWHITFVVPSEEVTEQFTNEMPAQLLIRWIVL